MVLEMPRREVMVSSGGGGGGRVRCDEGGGDSIW